MKTGLFGVVACSKTRVRCIFCGVFIPKASRCIEQHLNGARHKENMELMNDNGINFINDTLYCRPCQRNLSQEESLVKHIEDEEHSNWIVAADDLTDGEFIALEAYLSSEADELVCEVCETNLDCALLSIEAHVNNIEHRTKVTERLKPLNGIFTTEHGDEVWCKVCNVYFENTIPNILSHIDDEEQHMVRLTEIEDLTEDQEMSIENFLANEQELNAYCKKCHVDVLCNAENLQSHIQSEAHLIHFGL